VIVAAVAPALFLVAAHSASAGISCRYDPAKHLLSVGAIEKNLIGAEAGLRRVGDRIRVTDDFSGHRINCHGSPTVTNTDRIKLRAVGVSSNSVSLAGGPFAPGATPELDGSPEIEFTVSGGGLAVLSGGPGADHFSYTTVAGRSGISLNPGPEDEDIDFLTPDPRTLFIADGGPGPDTIDVLQRPRVEVQERGGPGNDSLSAAGSPHAILEGDEGADRLIGGAGNDIITPGTGADLVQAEGGFDEIKNAPDRSPDSIDCGAGPDLVVERESRDRLRSCETVRPSPFG
jgi:RTX calcium-binding nonapeptide repeat (4 copies)